MGDGHQFGALLEQLIEQRGESAMEDYSQRYLDIPLSKAQTSEVMAKECRQKLEALEADLKKLRRR